MSRQNKVNPGMYTQRGRLTQDDAARELKRQRSIGSPHTWQPVQRDAMPRLAPNGEASRSTETSEDEEIDANDTAPMKAKPAKAKAARKTAAKAKTAKPAAKAKTAKAGAARRATGKAQTRKSAKPAAKAAKRATTRQAVLARNVGGGAPKPRAAAKRGKR